MADSAGMQEDPGDFKQPGDGRMRLPLSGTTISGWDLTHGCIHRRYGELMALERESLEALSAERRAELLERLREHIAFVRRALSGSAP